MQSVRRVLYLSYDNAQPIYEIMRREMAEGLELALPGSAERGEVLRQLGEADFVIAIHLDAEMIAAARRLKLIQLAGVGCDGVDLAAATRAGIPVAQTVEGTITGVAEHAMLLILALYKRLLEADASVRRGEWKVWQLRPESYTLAGKTVGIVGLGRIGREVALRCRAFGASLCYTDARRAEDRVEQDLGVRFLPRDELLASADVVTLHLPLLPETRRSFGEGEFRRMKRTAVLINTARGGLVDEPALVRALREGWIAGAGLDVYASEPPEPNSPLLRLPNTVLTPHIATGTRDSIVLKTRAACENFHRVLRGERPLNVVNEEVFRR